MWFAAMGWTLRFKSLFLDVDESLFLPSVGFEDKCRWASGLSYVSRRVGLPLSRASIGEKKGEGENEDGRFRLRQMEREKKQIGSGFGIDG